jgi:hypothetical protein
MYLGIQAVEIAFKRHTTLISYCLAERFSIPGIAHEPTLITTELWKFWQELLRVRTLLT